MEPDFGTLLAWSPAIKTAFWDPWETALLGQILARSLLEPDFGTLLAWNPAIKTAFWDPWETALLGQILARSLLEPDFGTLLAWSPAIKNCLLGSLGNSPFGPNPGQEPFGARFWHLGGLRVKDLLFLLSVPFSLPTWAPRMLKTTKIINP